MPEIFFHQRRCQVEPRADASSRAQPPVAHMNGILLDHHVRESLAELLGHGPVCGDPLSAQQVGCREYESATADRSVASRAQRTLPEPVEHLARHRQFNGVGAASDEQGVDGFVSVSVDGPVRYQSHTGRTARGTGGSGGDDQSVHLPLRLRSRFGKDVQRASSAT